MSVSVSSLRLSDRRIRRPTENELSRIRRQLELNGFVVPVVVQASSLRVISGNVRVSVARELGIEEVPAMLVDVPDHQADALALAMNQVSGEWDKRKLSALLGSLVAELGGVLDVADFSGFSEEEVTTLLPKDFDQVAGDVLVRIGEFSVRVSSDLFDRWWSWAKEQSPKKSDKEVTRWVMDRLVAKIAGSS